MSMKQCLDAIIRYQRRNEDEYVTRLATPGTQRNIKYEELNQFLGMTSLWLADVFMTEYKFGKEVDAKATYTMEDDDLWLRVGVLDEELPALEIPLRISTGSDEVKRKKQMTEQDKYKSVQEVFNRITVELTDLPEEKFNSALENLESWWSKLHQGDTAMASSEGDVAMPASGTVGDSAESELPPTQVAEREEKDDQVHTTPGETSPTSTKKAKKSIKAFTERIRHGRPRKDRAAAAAQIRQARNEYNKGVKLRNAVRGDDVVDVEEFVKTRQPPLAELSSFINTFEVSHYKHAKKALSVEKRVCTPTIVPYRLPESMIREGLRLIECEAPFGDTMDLCSPPESSAECWVISRSGNL
ncbi:hypothetical protein ON010_g13649 [Phytophthora cinnamomi]|nr:hypothetical protein ON010_g13649 [Phytophthora cinnamomi]